MYRRIEKTDWPSAELRDEDVLIREIKQEEIFTSKILLRGKPTQRMFVVEKLGPKATEVDSRLEEGKVVVPVIELMKFYSDSGYYVSEASNIALVWPKGYLDHKEEEENDNANA